MANQKLSALAISSPRGTPDRANDVIYVEKAGVSYGSTVNNELGISGNPVGDTDSQTLTNKTLTSPTISGPTLSGTLTGTYTLGGTPTFPASVVTLTGSQTLTNKVLTSPTISAPTITNASITADAITGFTNANNGTIYGIPVTSGTLGTGALATNAVQSNQLATNAIFLNIASITSNFSTSSATAVQVTGMSVTVTIPSGARRVKITAMVGALTQSGANRSTLSLWRGTVGSGTQLGGGGYLWDGAGAFTCTAIAVDTPSAGSVTYNLGLAASAGASTVNASVSISTFIMAEVI